MRTLVVLAMMAAAPALAAPACADPNPDAGFLATLDKASITYQSGPEAVAAAKQVCDWINQGQVRSDVIKTVSAGNPGFTMSDAATFTTLSERAYCPQPRRNRLRSNRHLRRHGGLGFSFHCRHRALPRSLLN
ncbi:MAG: DUF732 domain-containing protein [Mycobacterium sp.]